LLAFISINYGYGVKPVLESGYDAFFLSVCMVRLARAVNYYTN